MRGQSPPELPIEECNLQVSPETLLSCEAFPPSKGKAYFVFVCVLLSGSICGQMAGLRVGYWGRMSERNSEEAPPIMITGTKAVGAVTVLKERGALEGFVPAITCSAYCE